MKKIAIIQSNYIPWKGYFDIIHKVDHFVFLDTAQYTTRDWRNRNLIKTPDGCKWLTVPVNGSQSMQIKDVKIDNSADWQSNHFLTLKYNYRRCDHFDDLLPLLDDVYRKHKWTYLSELNQFVIKRISSLLRCKTYFHNADEFVLETGKNEKIISIIKQLKGDHYITGPSAADYLKPVLFSEAGITLEFMNYSEYPVYPQPWQDFVHEVTVLDLLFCTGKNAAKYIWKQNANTN